MLQRPEANGEGKKGTESKGAEPVKLDLIGRDNASSTTSMSNSSPRSAATSIIDGKWNPNAGDSITELSRACGAKLPLISTQGTVCGYTRKGAQFEVLIREAKGANVRFRLVLAKVVIAFDPLKPESQNLVIGQRELERDEMESESGMRAKCRH